MCIYLVYQMMNDFGVDSPLCSFAYLTVNGEDWGLYLAVEGIEDSFLSRNYGSEVGDLYKPDSISNGGGRGNGKDFDMDDFDFGDTESGGTESGENQQGNQPGGQQGKQPGGQFNPGGQSSIQQGTPGEQGGFALNNQGGFGQNGQRGVTPGDNNGGMQGGGMGSDDVKLKYIDDDPDSYSNIFSSAKTDVTSADEARLIQALENLSNYSNIENTVDIDEVIRYFVIHNFVCNGDSYTGSMIHNYYLYEEDGILSMIPWDYNLAYGTFQGSNASDTVNTSIDSPVSGGTVDDRPMLGWIFSDETYTEQYHALFAEFIEKWFTNGELADMIAKTAEMIRPYVEKDPTKFCTTEEFDAGVTALSQFVTLRAEAVGNQLNGDNTKVDTDSLNLSDMGTMNAGAGGGGGMDVPGMQNMNLFSFVTLKDAEGNAVDVTTVIPTTATVVSVTLLDESTVDFSSANMQTLRGLDVSKIVSAADSDGNSYDLSSYTISTSVPTRPDGESGNGENVPSMPDSPGKNGGNAPSDPDSQGETSGTAPAVSSGSEASTDSQNGNQQQNQKGFPSGNNDQRQTSNEDGGNGQMNYGEQSVATDTPSETTKWILVGASVLVLTVGVFIVLKKKYE